MPRCIYVVAVPLFAFQIALLGCGGIMKIIPIKSHQILSDPIKSHPTKPNPVQPTSLLIEELILCVGGGD
jgi:hypothetical protein